MFLHIVQSTLGDALLQDEVFQLMSITIILDSSSYFTEAVQKDLVICTVLLIIPVYENKRCLMQQSFTIITKECPSSSYGEEQFPYLSKLQQGLKRSTRMCIFSSSPKDR